MGEKRGDVAEVYCYYRGHSGRLMRVTERIRATGNIIVKEKAMATDDDTKRWKVEEILGKEVDETRI